MNPDTAQGVPTQQFSSPLQTMHPGEQVVCEIRRHPIGIFGVYLAGGLVILIALAAAFMVPTLLPMASSQIRLGAVLGALLIVIITLLYVYVAAVVYHANRWLVTSDSLTQVTQAGLLDKQTSQLSLANLEDVTVEQDGLLQSVFGFGLLRVETAGEHSKFTFPFCPKPSEYASKIINAHEAYIANNPEGMSTANRAIADTHSLNQPGSS